MREEQFQAYTSFDVLYVALCAATCLLGIQHNSIQCTSAQETVALVCLATKCIMLINWKIRKPELF